MLSALLFVVVLSALILVHELGHYLAAIRSGVKAEEFGYGFPPRAIGFVRERGKWKRIKAKDNRPRANTVWSLNWLPFGGFVRMKGEMGEAEKDADSFVHATVGRRLFILLAGVGMNWLLAIVIFSIGFSVGIPAELTGVAKDAIVTNRVIEITDVASGSSAAASDLQPGDALTSINGIPVTDADMARKLLATVNPIIPVTLGLTRNGDRIQRTVHLAFFKPLNRPALGVALDDVGTVRYSVPHALFEGVRVTIGYTGMIVGGFGQLLKDLVTNGGATADVSGPVGIAIMTGRVARQGIWPLLHFTALLSINLGIINVLPIPALDGGRVFFTIIEWFRRRKISLTLESAIHRIGFAALLVLIALITVHDVARVFFPS